MLFLQWEGVSYENAAAYTDSLYGTDGVPIDAVDSVFYNFYPDGSSQGHNISNGFMETNMLYLMTTETEGHATNGNYYDSTSGNIMYIDSQTQDIGIVNIEEVIDILTP